MLQYAHANTTEFQMSLQKFINEQNRMADLFGGKKLDRNNLSEEDKLNLAKSLLSALSPESLTCDGERPRAQVRARSIMLNAAKAELEALGQKVEWDVCYPR